MRRLARFAPSLVAVLLSLPGFRYPYLFDDFDFLGRVQDFRLWKLLPNPSVVFWRPVSRELYFALVYAFGDAGPLVGHALNALLLALAAYLLVGIGATLGSRKAGLAAGFAFAGFAQSPFLVAWLSGAQDLLAIVFMLAAIRLRLDRRFAPAAAALALALLSKETAFAIIPILIFLDWFRGGGTSEVRRGVALFGGIGLVWAAIHPGIRLLLAAGFQDTPGGYVGLSSPHRWDNLWKSLVTLANLPVSGLATPVDGLSWGLLAASLAIVVVGVVRGWDPEPADPKAGESGRDAAILVGAALAVLPLALTVTIVRGWTPYYMVIPFLGVALLVGSTLALGSRRTAATSMAALFLLGGWSQNAVLESGLPTMDNLRPASQALAKVEAGFKSLRPTMPRGTDLLVSVHSVGAASVYVHLYLFQALRVWYRDATLVTHRPDYPIRAGRPHLLFWVDPEFGVHEIDLRTFAARPTGDRAIYEEYKKTLRYYARGLAAGGDAMRAAFILARIPEEDPVIRGIDVRTAVMFFLYRGRAREARMLLEHVPDLPVEARIAGMGAVLTYSPGEVVLDDYAFAAFELDASDKDLVTALGRRFAADGRRDLAARFGRRLLALDPGNREGQRWIDDLENLPPKVKITEPIGEGVETPFR